MGKCVLNSGGLVWTSVSVGAIGGTSTEIVRMTADASSTVARRMHFGSCDQVGPRLATREKDEC